MFYSWWWSVLKNAVWPNWLTVSCISLMVSITEGALFVPVSQILVRYIPTTFCVASYHCIQSYSYAEYWESPFPNFLWNEWLLPEGLEFFFLQPHKQNKASIHLPGSKTFMKSSVSCHRLSHSLLLLFWGYAFLVLLSV